MKKRIAAVLFPLALIAASPVLATPAGAQAAVPAAPTAGVICMGNGSQSICIL